MTLERLQSEMVKALKAGDKFRKNVISTTIAQVKNMAIDKGCRDNIPESIVDEALLKSKKITQEMINSCPESRADLLEDYKKQMEVICEFAPSLITDEFAIRGLVTRYAIGNGIELVKSNRGAIMKLVAANLKGKADMSVVNKVVNNLLQ